MLAIRSAARIYAAFFGLAFVLALAMLATDTNLQTDFGTVAKYYAHWYVVLVAAVADLAGAALLVASADRRAIKGGVFGSLLLSLVFLADVFTYQQVGFPSASAFWNYLDGATYYGGNIRYLYDVVVAVYLLTFVVGVALLYSTRERTVQPVASAPPPPS